MKIPSTKAMVAGVVMVGVSLIVLRIVGGLVPSVQNVPVIGKAFQ